MAKSTKLPARGRPSFADGQPHRLYDQHLVQIRRLARHNAALREVIACVHRQATKELAQPKLCKPCRKALVSLLDHWSGAFWSASLTAAIFSIVATLKLWNINPRRWLCWYLESCTATNGRVPQDVAQFLPWNLTAERRAELTSPEASVPINNFS